MNKCTELRKYAFLEPCLLYFLLSSDIRSEGSIAIVKIFDFDFLMIFHSTSLPKSKKCVLEKMSVCVCLSVADRRA